ncbi:MAG: hypothetical protein HY007_04020 [Candidatus Sungbacteria bacterium]|nr:hypothetical protein [Candidatus Sungbacteria bacterium]
MNKTITRKRVNITLPQKTLQLIKRVAPKGDRSRFLDKAVHFYVKEAGRENLRALLREGASRNAERDLGLVEEWFPLEQEVWRKNRKK